ncbi:MAG: response regulator transcription factor [Candidatus Nanopelagicales bacterium]
MSRLLLMTASLGPSGEVLPALGLLAHHVRVLPAEASALLNAPPADALLLDGRRDLAHVRALSRLIRQTGVECPVLLITTEGGLAAVNAEWGIDDVVLDAAGPAEVEARLRLAIGRVAVADEVDADGELRLGDLAIDESAYSARIRGHSLDLTFKEFELLRFLATHAGRVFTRAQLLQEVWGYDYFGGTRTVDVHVRRLRAKLGAEHEGLIGTVRNVGYRFVPPRQDDVALDVHTAATLRDPASR